MKFERTKEYMKKLFMEVMTDDKIAHHDAKITIERDWSKAGKLRAWCDKANGYIRFPNKLRKNAGITYIADVIEVKPVDRAKHFRVVPHSIRDKNNNVVG